MQHTNRVMQPPRNTTLPPTMAIMMPVVRPLASGGGSGAFEGEGVGDGVGEEDGITVRFTTPPDTSCSENTRKPKPLAATSPANCSAPD